MKAEPPVLTPDETLRTTLALAAAGGLLGPVDIQIIFGIKHSRFAVLNKAGAFDFLKVSPAVGPKCFSGVKVMRYLAAEPVYAPSFGRKTFRR